MHVLNASILLLLLVWVTEGQAAPKNAPDPELDEESVVAEVARRLRPLESLESKQRRLEELEARKNMLDNLESSHRSLEGVESQYMSGGGGCGGGCSHGRVRSRVAENLESELLRDHPQYPRPIYGLISNILETARMGVSIDRPRAHVIF